MSCDYACVVHVCHVTMRYACACHVTVLCMCMSCDYALCMYMSCDHALLCMYVSYDYALYMCILLPWSGCYTTVNPH